MPYIRLASALAVVTSVVPMTHRFPSVLEEPLSEDNDDALHHVLILRRSSSPNAKPSPEDFRNALFHVFCEKLSDDWTHGGIPVDPDMHVSDVFNQTLWHMQTCHPHPTRLILVSTLSMGMSKITHLQDIEQCLQCPIAKMRKTARGHDTGFKATAVGQGLAMDIGFMFQKLKNNNRAKNFMCIKGGNAYCIIYDLFSELLFGATTREKSIPITWLHVLFTCIAPKDHPVRIVRLDIGGETGKNPEVAAKFLKHQYILQTTGAGASSQNGSAERPHSIIGAAIRAMFYSVALKPKLWEYAFYFYLRMHLWMRMRM
jgi:hypothetical protein